VSALKHPVYRFWSLTPISENNTVYSDNCTISPAGVAVIDQGTITVTIRDTRARPTLTTGSTVAEGPRDAPCQFKIYLFLGYVTLRPYVKLSSSSEAAMANFADTIVQEIAC